MRTIYYRQAVAEALAEEMERDPNVMLLGLDVGRMGHVFQRTAGLLRHFGPARVKDTAISENAIAGVAVGAAMMGLRPVADIQYMNFMTLAMDQVVNHAAKMRYMFGGGDIKFPVVFTTQQGTGTSNGGQHSDSWEAWFTHIPGLKVVIPGTPYDVKGLLKSAIRDDNPVVFIEHKRLFSDRGPVPEEEYTIPLGSADIKRKGSDVTLITWSWMLGRSLAAAEELATQGIDVEVVDPRTLAPLDTNALIESARKTGKAVIVHEANKTCGVGAEIACLLTETLFYELEAPIVRLAGKDIPIPYETALEAAAVPSKEEIMDAVRHVMEDAGK